MDGVSWSRVEHAGARCDVVTVALAEAEVALVTGPSVSAIEARPGLLAATNGGLFHSPDRAVGWTVVAGAELRPIERGEGAGNFFLKPNGAFWVDAAGPHVARTERIAPSGAVSLATQSGPLLVEGGVLHPAFRAASDSRKPRNGVGVVDAGSVVLAACDDVNFHGFATLFRDVLHAPDALFLDGTISTLFGPGHPPDTSARSGSYATFLVVTPRARAPAGPPAGG